MSDLGGRYHRDGAPLDGATLSRIHQRLALGAVIITCNPLLSKMKISEQIFHSCGFLNDRDCIRIAYPRSTSEFNSPTIKPKLPERQQNGHSLQALEWLISDAWHTCSQLVARDWAKTGTAAWMGEVSI